MNPIAEHLKQVQERIQQAARAAQRDPAEVQLLAVSKTKPLEAICEAYRCGQRRFGESYAQEAVTKVRQLRQQPEFADIEWHFIGPLQSNKTRPVAEHFDWVHSIDRLKIAQRLSDQRPNHLSALNICLQVNISGESQKSGTTEAQVFELADAVSRLPRLQLRGLMAIAEDTRDDSRLQQDFTRLQRLFAQLKLRHPSMDTLSMGMTNDLEVAVACGSTLVRIGTAIFGTRDYKQD